MDSGGGTNGADPRDTVHYPKVVLVTGACRFLGGYLTARLAQNPLINHVIAVDAIAPSKDLLRRMGRAEFVRADIRNPFIAKVIRNGDVDTVVHAAAASYAPRAGGRAALKEQNVMGAMQLFAACQKAPSVPRSALAAVDSLRRATRYTELDREQLNYLSYGRVMDTTRMRKDLGYSPKWTTAEAFDDYVRGRGLTPIIDPRWVLSVENRA